ncbi:hypothetical protein MMO38_05520 [Acinetobacter sp. NIPH 1852]|uniref:hypothetical protein n=1 Tax=Acinetobacter sp. NIPH 1852 TaxID=2923428 RepID=UPI001B592C69|nr:hypothetical protein [Acinetobacter sp. NIPH 1852]MBP7880222.1 hypothetical protein [Acinetobacter sp.]MCH7307599.1 hypothetical protein [Acinetobacter sp. NIPH 1852]
MTRLAVHAEIIKLARILKVSEQQLLFLQKISPESLRQFRFAIIELLQDQQKARFRHLATWVNWLPNGLNVFMVKRFLDPLIVAQIAVHLSTENLYRIAKKLSAETLAEISVHLDPRLARELLVFLTTHQIMDIAQVLLQQRDFVTMGRFVSMLSDEVVQDVAQIVEQESDLLEIAFYIESRERIDHLVHVLPKARIEKALLIICDPAQRLVWPKLLALMSHIGYELKQELGDLAVQQGETVINAIIQAAQEDQLWEDMLPVVAGLSAQAQHYVANLPALRQVDIIQSIVAAADHCHLWTDMLVVVNYMQDQAREVVATAIAQIDEQVLHHIAYASLLRSQWEVTFDIVGRMPIEKQRQCRKILNVYMQQLDAETYQYLDALLDHYQIDVPAVH